MNLYYDDKAASHSEYQNQPLLETEGGREITEETVRAKAVSTFPRFVVPLECQHVALTVDVHKGCLFWMLGGFTDNFSGHVLDYGTFPDQKTPWPFEVDNCRFPLEDAFPTLGLEGAIYSSLDALTNNLLSRTYTRGSTAWNFRSSNV